MVIEEILIHNVGTFRGEQRAILAPPSKNKPVVLFGGLNGAGKTTLLEAMQLVLYGRSAANGRKTVLEYEEYLRRLINRQVNPRDGAAVEVKLRVNEDGQSRLICVRRTWTATGSRIAEKLEVMRDGCSDQHLTDTWLDYVGRLMPPQLSELFFFDGERIESLADPTQSLEILRSAIHTLLGVDLVKQLQADLVVLNRRKLIERRSGPERVHHETAAKTAQDLQEKLRDLKQSRAQLQRDVDYAAKRLNDFSMKFDREGGVFAEDRAAIEQHHGEMLRNKGQIEIELREIAAGCLPLAILRPTLINIRAQAAKEASARESAVARDLAEQRDRRLVKRLRNEFKDGRVVKTVARFLAEREAAQKRYNELESQLKRLDADVASLSRDVDLRARELNKLNEEARVATLGNEESDRFIQHADAARDALERFRLAVTKKHADRLAAKIFVAFGQLLRKQRLMQHLTIDPDTCRLVLQDFDGNELPSERLSAGERQLLAVSILWGLGQATGRPLPVIIDTPLGRLDTKHRMHLVERYFPFASHQVILLSTDEEITDEYLRALKPKIGRCYRLIHDDAERATTIESGYFED